MQTKGLKGFIKKLRKYRSYLLMLLPAVIYTLVFSYYPMTGVILAFKKYTYAGGIWGSAWNGIENFKFFFKSGQAGIVTRNTVLYNILFIVVGTIVQIAVAIFLTEIRNKHFRKFSQSFMFLQLGLWIFEQYNYKLWRKKDIFLFKTASMAWYTSFL